jgi:hypothetical protein
MQCKHVFIFLNVTSPIKSSVSGSVNKSSYILRSCVFNDCVSAVPEPQTDQDQPPASTEVSIDVPRKNFVFWLSKNPSKPI